MSDKFERQFRQSMDKINLSSGEKEKIFKKLTQSINEKSGAKYPKSICSAPIEKKRRKNMKNWTLPKAVAIAAACIMVTGVTAFAASRIMLYEVSSNSDYDYKSAEDMNLAEYTGRLETDKDTPLFPETLGDGFIFDGGNNLNVEGEDDSGSTVDKWKDLSAIYKNKDGKTLNLYLSGKAPDEEDRIPTETRGIKGITTNYNYDEYLFLPDEDKELAPEVKVRMENDDHFYVSYGSREEETYFFSSISFINDGISYHLLTKDDVSADELFSIAEELINR